MTDSHITPHEIDRADVADSPAARAIGDRIAAGRHELARRIGDRFREEDRRTTGSSSTSRCSRMCSRFALDSLDARPAGPGTGSRLEPARDAARRRVHQRGSLESFLHAGRIWARVVWDAVLEEVRPDRRDELEAALTVALRLLSQIDQMSTLVADAYLDEVGSDRGLLRRDLMDALISGRGDTRGCEHDAPAQTAHRRGHGLAAFAEADDE